MKRLIFLLTNLFASTAYLMASGYHATTYNALGGDVVNDDLSDALKLLKKPLAISKTGVYRAVVKSNAGSAVWIGNGKTKSYFVTVGHVVNSATNTFTTHNGTTISPVAGSVFHRRDGDFGLLEYNALLDPMLFGGRSMILMDHNLVNNYAGRQTTIVGYGNIKIGGRSLGRHRMLSYSTLTPRIRLDDYTTRSVTNADDPRPYAGVATQGDSGGGVFMQANGENVLIGTLSAAGSSALYYTNLYYHKSFINSVVPKGVFQWFSEYKNTFTPVAGKKYYIDNPKHKLRLGATGTSGSLYTTANDTTGENVEWEFIAQNDGTYHIQLAKRNSKCRLCSVNTNKPAMRVMNYSGLFTRYVMEKAPGDNNYHITLPNVNSSIARLQVHSNGTPKFQSDTFDGTWVAFQFKEVPDNIVSIQKRYSKQHALASKGNAGSGGNVFLSNHVMNAANQRWQEIDRGDGFFSYQKLGKGISLQANINGDTGNNLFLWKTKWSNKNQHWRKVHITGSIYRLESRNSQGYSIDGGSTAYAGQNVVLGKTKPTWKRQKWIIQ